MSILKRASGTWGILVACFMIGGFASSFAAEVGGKPEKPDVIVTYAQPSGVFTPIWVAHRKDAVVAKKTIGKYAKIEDGPTIDGTYEAFAPYWAMSLAVRPEAVKGQFDYLDEREFPNAKNADPRDFYDNAFVDALTKSGFLKNLGMK
jgi:hypothetical protein